MATNTVTLKGSAPWGFRLQGGQDFNMPLGISRVSEHTCSRWFKSCVRVTSDVRYSDCGVCVLYAKKWMNATTMTLSLTNSDMRCVLAPSSVPSAVVAASTEYLPNFNPIALKDSALSTNKPIEVRGPGGKATIIRALYNTPISMYSQDAIMDAIAGQSHEDVPAGSPLATRWLTVYQAVIQQHDRDEEMAEWARRAANLQSKSFRILAHLTGTEYMQDPDEEFESEVKGPRFRNLKNWPNGLSAQILNIPETPF
uniref:LIM domain binding 3b n=1 Tax=Oncorhynchus tshawytscha TaxID=74940 RepID=A0A8C8GFF7_ONCTS